MEEDIKLTKKQQEAVDYDGKDLLIRGIAGSGKTTVLLNKAHKILTKYPDETVYLFTYNATLASYAKELASLIGSNRLHVYTFHSWTLTILGKHGTRPQLIMGDDQKASVKKSIEAVKKRKKHRYVVEEKYFDFLMDEISWMKGKEIYDEKKYLEADRAGRGSKVFVDQNDRSVIFEIFRLYQDGLAQSNRKDFDDLAHLLNENLGKLKEYIKMDNVLVDEAQDLQEVQLRLLKCCATKRIVIAADKGQKIYNTSFTWRNVGINITGGRTKVLQDSFRSTKQIIALAHSLQKHDPICKSKDEEYVQPILPEREGPMPVLVDCLDYLQEEEYVVHAIHDMLQKKSNWTIGLLCRKSAPLARFYTRLNSMGIPVEYVSKNDGSVIKPGVKLLTFHSVKGLEFDSCFLIRLREKVMPVYNQSDELDEETLARERRLLYVAMTRAKSVLYMTYYDKLSRFFEEMDSSLYSNKEAVK